MIDCFRTLLYPATGGSDEQAVMSPLKPRAPILKEKKLDRNGRYRRGPSEEPQAVGEGGYSDDVQP